MCKELPKEMIVEGVELEETAPPLTVVDDEKKP